MTILDGVREAVTKGQLQERFSAKEVLEALRKHHFSLGSIAVTLARYSRPRPNQPDPPLRRVGPGQYKLASLTAASQPCRPRRKGTADRSAHGAR